MNIDIRAVQIDIHRLSAAEAELWIKVIPEKPADGLTIAGRLSGPRCPFISTVEVAYSLMPLPPSATDQDGLSKRIIIPEPSLWTPETPFLYEGFVDLLHHGVRQNRRVLCQGLVPLKRMTPGWWLQGKPITLSGIGRDDLTQEEALQLRQAGFNTLCCAVTEEMAALQKKAERWGFFIVGQLSRESLTLVNARGLHGQDNCLGWLIPQEDLSGAIGESFAPKEGMVFGLRLTDPPTQSPPSWISFIACSSRLAKEIASLPLPKLILIDPHHDDLPASLPPDCLGTIILAEEK